MARSLKDYAELTRLLSSSCTFITNLPGNDDYQKDATEKYGRAEVLVMASCEADVIATVNFCQQREIPLVPRGAGTGLSGGCVPTEGGIVLSTENINQLKIHPDAKTAVCGPGVITSQVLEQAAVYELTYPPDPASYTESTLGGNVAENAGGLRCKRFGVTRDYVLGLRGVTIDGEVIKTGCYIDNRGFNLIDLMIGSEGTLVIITEITVRLISIPSRGATILVAFGNPENAARTVSDITGSGIIPTVLEYLDGDAVDCSNRYEKTDGLDRIAALLLIETSGEDKENQVEIIRSFCKNNQCTYLRIEDKSDRVEQLWQIRRNLSNAIKEAAKIRISEDVAVPISRFPDLVAFVAKLNQGSKIRINSFGHAGDGNLHVCFLAQTGDSEEMAEIQQGVRQLMQKTVDFGGTLTGEHGIGTEKRAFLSWEFDEPTLNAMRKIKAIFDSEALLNPGTIL